MEELVSERQAYHKQVGPFQPRTLEGEAKIAPTLLLGNLPDCFNVLLLKRVANRTLQEKNKTKQNEGISEYNHNHAETHRSLPLG